MRIATVTSGPPTGLQGTERFLAALTSVLRAEGAEVVHFHFGQVRTPRPGGLYERLGLSAPVNALILARRARAARPRFDLFIAHGLCGWRLPPERTVVIYHGCYAAYAEAFRERLSPRGYVTMRWLWGWPEQQAGRARAVVAISRENARQIERFYGIRPTHIILNAVDITRYAPVADKAEVRRLLGLPLERPIALFCGAWGYPKGADLVADAAALLHPDVLVAAASYATPVDVAVPEAVRFFLRQSPEQMLQLYQAADAFLFPSRAEACSLALAEAMSCGLVPVASRVGAWEEILECAPELDSLFLPVGATGADYAAAVMRVLSSPRDLARRSGAAAATARRLFSPERFASDYRRLLAEVSRPLARR